MPYLNVVQVERAVRVLTLPPNDKITQLIELPHPTREKRTCHAIKIASESNPGRTFQ